MSWIYWGLIYIIWWINTSFGKLGYSFQYGVYYLAEGKLDPITNCIRYFIHWYRLLNLICVLLHI